MAWPAGISGPAGRADSGGGRAGLEARTGDTDFTYLVHTHTHKQSPGTGELGYDGLLYDGILHMTDDMLGPSPIHIKYSSYVYDRFCI